MFLYCSICTVSSHTRLCVLNTHAHIQMFYICLFLFINLCTHSEVHVYMQMWCMYVCVCVWVCVCVDLHHPWLCQPLHLSSVSRCSGPNPSCRPPPPHRAGQVRCVFPLNQTKKVKKENMASWAKGFGHNTKDECVIQHNKRCHLCTTNYGHIISQRLLPFKNTNGSGSWE